VALHDTSKFTGIHLEADELIKKHKFFKEDFGKFQPIGALDNMHTLANDPAPTDIFGLLRNVSKSAYVLFDDLKRHRDPKNNLATYALKRPTKSQTVVFNRCLRELKEQLIIITAKTTDMANPIPKNTYLINPALLKCREITATEAMWDILVKLEAERKLALLKKTISVDN